MIRQLRSRISLTIKVSVDNVIKDYDINSVTFNEVIDAIRVGRALMEIIENEDKYTTPMIEDDYEDFFDN